MDLSVHIPRLLMTWLIFKTSDNFPLPFFLPVHLSFLESAVQALSMFLTAE